MIGTTVSHYEILEKLGEGGMGVVYKAHDQRLDRSVALKFLPLHLSANPEANERFIREAKAASGLDHPNICTIYGIGETDEGQLFIAMAFYQGQTLKKKIARGPVPVADAVDIAIQIAEGLARAHAAGIIWAEPLVEDLESWSCCCSSSSAAASFFGRSRDATEGRSRKAASSPI